MDALVSYPPRYGPPSVSAVKTSPRRFSTARTIDGHEVVDFDGRAVIAVGSEGEAVGFARSLNDAAAGGIVPLTRAIQKLSSD